MPKTAPPKAAPKPFVYTRGMDSREMHAHQETLRKEQRSQQQTQQKAIMGGTATQRGFKEGSPPFCFLAPPGMSEDHLRMQSSRSLPALHASETATSTAATWRPRPLPPVMPNAEWLRLQLELAPPGDADLEQEAILTNFVMRKHSRRWQKGGALQSGEAGRR